MKRKMDTSELIFKVVAYVFLIVFALCCVYPFIYAIACSVSNGADVDAGNVVLLPTALDFTAYIYIFTDNTFWVAYANTIFVAGLGTIWCMAYTLMGAYALSKKRLMGRHAWNFFLVFTMWFSAGIVPQYLNYQTTGSIMASLFGTTYDNMDQKWLIIIAMGMNAQNVILLRNSFEGVPAEIEEAARIDGATEMQILFNVYIPMSKATIATVALFFGISRWNGYFWSMKMMPKQQFSWPVQVYIRNFIDEYTGLVESVPEGNDWTSVIKAGYDAESLSVLSVMYAMVICGVIPILCIYPFIQKYFAAGVNMGGVKE